MNDTFIEFRSTFYEETEENLDALNNVLVTFEKNPSDLHLVDGLFRMLHTIKSSSASVGLMPLSEFAHKAENLVQRFRSGAFDGRDDVYDILFSVFDQIAIYIKSAREGLEDRIDFSALLRRIEEICPSGETARKNSTDDPETRSPDRFFTLTPPEKQKAGKARKRNLKIVRVHVQIDSEESIPWLRAELILRNLAKTGDLIRVVPDRDSFASDKFDGLLSAVVGTRHDLDALKRAVEIDLVEHVDIREISDLDAPMPHPAKKPRDPQKRAARETGKTDAIGAGKLAFTDNTIRVPVKRLDELIRMVGELTVIRAGLKHFEKSLKNQVKNDSLNQEIDSLNDKIAKVSNGMQRVVLKTRMLPVDALFNPYVRVVRDLASKGGKEIDLVIRGGETELDKKVIDAIGDPLTHLIRNAIDHGIEKESERLRLDKPANARIELTAEQSGRHIVITVKDDGRGIDTEKVKRKAVQMGLLHSDGNQEIGENELYNVLFEPGFSTMDEVSMVSGRGVGLDVVKNVVNNLNGRVQIGSRPGIGTTVTITLPLTLAVSSVFVVESHDHQYGIPLNSVVESVKISGEEIQGKECARVVHIRDRVVPIVGLDDALEAETRRTVPDARGMVSVVIVSCMDREIGLVVDRIIGKQEIVLKSLEQNFKSIRGLSGAAILGDGSIVLVVDTLHMLQIHREREAGSHAVDLQSAGSEN